MTYKFLVFVMLWFILGFEVLSVVERIQMKACKMDHGTVLSAPTNIAEAVTIAAGWPFIVGVFSISSPRCEPEAK